jgi:multidrug transporter EmrE-like cation transporter
MTASAFAFLFAGVVLNAGAQLLLKAGTNTLGVITLTRDNWWDMLWKMGTQGFFVAGVVCYMISLLVWIICLSRVPVSVAYPMLSLDVPMRGGSLPVRRVSLARWLASGSSSSASGCGSKQ